MGIGSFFMYSLKDAMLYTNRVFKVWYVHWKLSLKFRALGLQMLFKSFRKITAAQSLVFVTVYNCKLLLLLLGALLFFVAVLIYTEKLSQSHTNSELTVSHLRKRPSGI